MSVHDPRGDWSLELYRHDDALDLLFRGDADLGGAVRAAETDIRAALTGAGHTLGSFEFSQQRDGRHTPPEPRPALASNAPDQAPRASKRPEDTAAPAGRRVHRVA